MSPRLCINIHCATVADHECGTEQCSGACKCIVLKEEQKTRGKHHGPVRQLHEF